MKWKKFTLTTTTEAVDLVSSMLDDVGIEGIEVEDNVPLTEKETKGMFIDILPERPARLFFNSKIAILLSPHEKTLPGPLSIKQLYAS